uniref:hypothetical protein n=1 Tax=Roseovarius autotrophicus TaxID=2824121 RepID=UPI001B37F8A3
TTPAMISPAQLAQVGGGGWEYSPVVATTSGTAFDFTGIPEGVTEIEAIYRDIRFTATDHALIQLGTNAGFQTTGYDSASGTGVRTFIKRTTGFALVVDGSTNRAYGKMTILNSGSGDWDETHNGSEMREGLGINGAGHVNITGAVDRLRLTRSGTATFNSGSFYIRWRK